MAIAALPALFAAAGFLFGYGYFLTLRRSLARYVTHRAWLSPLLVALVRLAAAALFFAVVARWGAVALRAAGPPWGALPLLAAFAGFLIARQLTVRGARGAA